MIPSGQAGRRAKTDTNLIPKALKMATKGGFYSKGTDAFVILSNYFPELELTQIMSNKSLK